MSKATMVAVIALATLHGDGRKKIAGTGDQITLPEADADRLKALGLVKFAEMPAGKSANRAAKTNTSKPAASSPEADKSASGAEGAAGNGGDGNGADGAGTGDAGAGNGGDGTGDAGTGAGNA